MSKVAYGTNQDHSMYSKPLENTSVDKKPSILLAHDPHDEESLLKEAIVEDVNLGVVVNSWIWSDHCSSKKELTSSSVNGGRPCC